MAGPAYIENCIHVTSYQANFACNHTRDRHVGFQTPHAGMGEYNKMSQNFLFSSYQITTEWHNISTHTQCEVIFLSLGRNLVMWYGLNKK